MRLIDADSLLDELDDLLSYVKLGEEHPYYSGEANALNVVIGKIKDIPTVDAVSIVRCKNCKSKEFCKFYDNITYNDEWLCPDGERLIDD